MFTVINSFMTFPHQVLRLPQINLDGWFSHSVWNWEGVCSSEATPRVPCIRSTFYCYLGMKELLHFTLESPLYPVFQKPQIPSGRKLGVATMFIILQSLYQIKVFLSEMRMCYANHKEIWKYYLVSSVFLFKDNSHLKVKSQPSATRLHKWIYCPDTGDPRRQRNEVQWSKSFS